MSALIFMDTETTGLSLDDDVWEFAAIRREPDGSETRTHLFIHHDPAKAAKLPPLFFADYSTRYDAEQAVNIEDAAHRIADLFHDRPHVVGAVPNFDTERLAVLLNRFGRRPGWHYHLIDVENLAVGYLAGTGGSIPLPWNSDDLSRACGVEPPAVGRHTAMGDAEWAMALYDKVMDGVA